MFIDFDWILAGEGCFNVIPGHSWHREEVLNPSCDLWQYGLEIKAQ
jgi:hypothetical protein